METLTCPFCFAVVEYVFEYRHCSCGATYTAILDDGGVDLMDELLHLVAFVSGIDEDEVYPDGKALAEGVGEDEDGIPAFVGYDAIPRSLGLDPNDFEIEVVKGVDMLSPVEDETGEGLDWEGFEDEWPVSMIFARRRLDDGSHLH